MMTKMELRSVEEILEGGILTGEDWVTNTHICVSPGIDSIKEDQVRSNYFPVLLTPVEERHQKCGTESGDVEEMFVEVLYKRR
mmetsp:Transcript_16645/g.23446  ORF Transcript_16645/g.23446 Transcript_16645/m.23446 type:complete len:83 (-) Transcript_16645:567-815(-)